MILYKPVVRQLYLQTNFLDNILERESINHANLKSYEGQKNGQSFW